MGRTSSQLGANAAIDSKAAPRAAMAVKNRVDTAKTTSRSVTGNCPGAEKSMTANTAAPANTGGAAPRAATCSLRAATLVSACFCAR